LIFPRYHQLDVVRKLIAHVSENSAGHNYLIQHSAGSGKSNSIAWTAYRLASLHDKDNNAIFSSVVVVTDRTVLDAQLQETILKDRLELTQQELAELSAQCGSVLRPTPDVIHYQSLYPDLYVPAPESQSIASDKVVYLTFDDGPSAITDQILKTLDKYGIKATFFVVPDGSAASNARLRAIVEAGHSIGIHTASHVYTSIYKSVEAYLQDFELAFRRVEQATGIRCDIFRFPGGSVNSYNRPVYQPLISEMLRRGFTYYDWNASSDDSAGQTTAAGIANRAVETTNAKRAILLCHDAPAKTATAKALPAMIEKLQAKGYRFEPMDNTIPEVSFAYK
jgi:peptidoglycan/xylan/chitin deacetylase (PgdA/CDA1 family)